MRIVALFNRDELDAMQYPVIVERWDKKGYGKMKRAYNATFTDRERNKLAGLYHILYRWYLVTGTPAEKQFHPQTVDLIQRAALFFASN